MKSDIEVNYYTGCESVLFMHTLQPGSPLCNVPYTALLNSFTLAPLYPYLPIEGLPAPSMRLGPQLKQHLNATQIISLHLALHRPRANSGSSDVSFGPYIDTLPKDFQGHPLTWLHRQKYGTATELERKLLQLLPASVITELCEVLQRLETDWGVVQPCLVSSIMFMFAQIDWIS